MDQTFKRFASVLIVATSLAFTSSVSRADILLDYSNDSFFAGNATARAALEAAASDINSVINFNLNAVTMDTVSGTSGGGSTQLDFDFSYGYSNPNTGASVTIANTQLATNEIRIFVGMRNLTGSTLGQGGPGGVGLQIGGFTGAGSAQDAINDAMSQYEHRRGSGPVISNLSGSIAGANYSFDIGSTVGNLWFDQDTDNNGSTDSAATLDANWHFNHLTSVAAGKDDFYSVALHEILHSIGYGTGDTWDSLRSGTTWMGAEGIAANGTGVGLIDGGGAHIAGGIQSARFLDGVLQDAVMTPSITTGTRKKLTQLDLAILRDLGYSTTSAVPEPGSLTFLLVVGCIVGCKRRRSIA